MKKVARVIGEPAWKKLNGKIIGNKCVEIRYMGNIHPYQSGPIFDSETVFMNKCDKNFVFYWLNKRKFPKVKSIYLASHPCEFGVLNRFHSDTKIYLSSQFGRYKERWAESVESVMVMEENKISQELDSLEEEELLIDPK